MKRFSFVFESYQCKRSAWRNAERPSIQRRIDTVRAAHAANMKISKIQPPSSQSNHSNA